MRSTKWWIVFMASDLLRLDGISRPPPCASHRPVAPILDESGDLYHHPARTSRVTWQGERRETRPRPPAAVRQSLPDGRPRRRARRHLRRSTAHLELGLPDRPDGDVAQRAAV